MTRPLASPERAAFYDDSHILTQESALAKHRAWEAGELVTSQMVAIGRITPTQEEENFFQSRQLQRNDYRLIEPSSNLRGIQLLGDALLTIVQQDMERGNLQGELVHKIHAGYYRDHIHREVWHSDNFSHPSVRWTVSFGVGSTRCATGHIQKSDILRVGDLRPNTLGAPGNDLQPATYANGEVLRFMNSADIHAGPKGDGARIMAQATLRLL